MQKEGSESAMINRSRKAVRYLQENLGQKSGGQKSGGQKSGGQKSGGFTLIEMMVVVAIISILAAIGIPKMKNFLQVAESVEAWEFFAHAKRDVADYYQKVGRFPKDNRAAGMPEPKGLQGRFVAGVMVEGGVITILMRESYQNKPIAFSMLPAVVTGHPTGSLLWYCLNPFSEGLYGTDPIPSDVTLIGKDRTHWSLERPFPFQCHDKATDSRGTVS